MGHASAALLQAELELMLQKSSESAFFLGIIDFNI